MRNQERMLSDLYDWLKNHHNNPSFIVGDFNMSKQDLKRIITSVSQQWFILELDGNQITWFNGGRSSCIDHVIVNDKMKNYLNKASVCNTFNDISDHYPIIFSCTNDNNYSDCAKCLLLLFNKIWNGDFPNEWNSASIVSIP